MLFIFSMICFVFRVLSYFPKFVCSSVIPLVSFQRPVYAILFWFHSAVLLRIRSFGFIWLFFIQYPRISGCFAVYTSDEKPLSSSPKHFFALSGTTPASYPFFA